MFPEVERFNRWLRCRNPHATTHIHYTSDLKLFFAWAGNRLNAVTLHTAGSEGRISPMSTFQFTGGRDVRLLFSS
jgi:hypothetical protein